MSKPLASAVLLPAAVCLCAAAVLAADPIGEAVAVQGYVTAVGTDGAARRLQLKSAVYLNDKITTGRSSRIQVMFDDDSTVSQGENSEMTIDEFVYSPTRREKTGCSLKLVSGLFRIVTGKVTSINPDRFKVQTRMATIGIRGCDLGFLVGDVVEDVYMLWVPDGKSILVQKRLAPGIAGGTAWSDITDILTVMESGIGVTIREGARLSERELTGGEMADFLRQLTVMPDRRPAGGDDSGGAAPGAAAGMEVARRVPDSLTGGALSQPAASGGETGQESSGETPPPASKPRGRPSLDNLPPTDPGPQTPPPSGGGPSTAPPPATPPGGLPPLPPAVVAQGAGTHWLWGIWDDGSMDHSGTHLALSDYDSIVIGTTRYSLTGTGQAGAFVTHPAGGNKVITGSCNLNIVVGQSVTPVWSGSFSLSNTDGDSLTFQANGNIGAGGTYQQTTPPTSYNLYVNRVSFSPGALTAQRIDGSLVGPGTGATPISGAEGSFTFVNGSEATVNGVYGADLR